MLNYLFFCKSLIIKERFIEKMFAPRVYNSYLKF